MVSNSYISSFKSSCFKVCAGFLMAILIVNLAIGFSMNHFDSNSTSVKGLDSRFVSDVMFIGDSRTNQGLDPRALSEYSMGKIRSVNLARAGMQTPMFYFLTRDYIDAVATPPKVILMNVSFYMLGGRQWFEDIYLAYYKPQLWQVFDAINTQLITKKEAIGWYFGTRIPMFRYKKRIAGLIDSFANDPAGSLFREFSNNSLLVEFSGKSNNMGYISRGASRSSPISDKDFENYTIGFDRGYDIYFDYLKRMFDFASRHRVHVLIYPFPWPEQAKNARNFNNVLKHYDEKVKLLAVGNPYVHFVEYDFYWQDIYFVDPLHLNQQGADLLTKQAYEWLKPYLIH